MGIDRLVQRIIHQELTLISIKVAQFHQINLQPHIYQRILVTKENLVKIYFFWHMPGKNRVIELIIHLLISSDYFNQNFLWNCRSGSSFTGELLSALPSAAYYYEPLFSLRPNGTAIENVIARDPSKAVLVKQRLMGIFDCNWPLLQKLNRNGFSSVRKELFSKGFHFYY